MARREPASEKDKGKIYGMVLYGCDPELAAHAVGWRDGQLRRELERDPEFAKDLAKNEGFVELHYMRTVHSAAKDERYWRAASWWLAQRSAERRDRKVAREITTAELNTWIEGLIEVIWGEVRAEEDRDRLIRRLLALMSAQDLNNVVQMVGEVDFEKEFGNGPIAED